MSSVNLGDSGFMILRKRPDSHQLETVHETKEQQHSFNFPYQVGTNGDDPAKGESDTHAVEDGDIIILGTDGLWDNMWREDMVKLV